MELIKKNFNLVLAVSCLIFFLLGFGVNDPFGYFETTYENSDPLIDNLEKSELARIEVYRKNRLQMAFIKETPSNDSWKVKGNEDEALFPVTPSKIQENIDGLYSIKKYQEVTSNKEKFVEFKVDPDSFKLSLYKRKQKKPAVSLYLGKSGTGFNSTLVRLEKENIVYSAKGNLKSSWEQNINHFRDRSLFRLSPENVISYSIQGKQNYSVKRKGKTDWQIFLPSDKEPSAPIAADQSKVDKVLEKIVKLEGSSFYEETPPEKLYATLTMTLTSKDKLRLEISEFTGEADYLVKSTFLPNWMQISKWKIEDIIIKPDDLTKKDKTKKDAASKK